MRGRCPDCGELLELDDVDLAVLAATGASVACRSCGEPIADAHQLDPV